VASKKLLLKNLRSVVGCAFFGALLVSCSSSGTSSGSEKDSSSVGGGSSDFNGAGGSFETIEALQEAYQSAGGICPTLSIRDSVSGQTSADCDSDTVLTIYESPLGPELNVLALIALDKASSVLFDIDLGGSNLVFGKNWLLNDGDSAIRKIFVEDLGGEEVLSFEPSLRDRLIAEVMSGEDGTGFSALISECTKVSISGDQTSVTFDTEGEEDISGDSLVEVYCSLAIVGAPDYVFDLIATTRALDGRQTESWGEFRASWSYHPNSGLQLVIVAEK